MTALSAGVALVPLMLGADAPGKEILHPVAITIFGGLVTATILDTVLTPTLFLRYGRVRLNASWRRHGPRPPSSRRTQVVHPQSKPTEHRSPKCAFPEYPSASA